MSEFTWKPWAPCPAGYHDAHEEHMRINGECPWCGMSRQDEEKARRDAR